MLALGYPCLQRITERLRALPVDSGSPELQGAHSGVQLQSQSLNEFPPFTENEFSQKATRRGKWAQGNPDVDALSAQSPLLWFVFIKTLRKKWRRYDCSSNFFYCSALCTFNYPFRGQSVIRCTLDFAS
jgi:hypothetical protein